MGVASTKHSINYASYRAQCNQYAVAVVQTAIDKETLPSRLGHVWVFSKALITLPVFLMEKIFRVAISILSQIAKLPFAEHKRARLNQIRLEVTYLAKTTLRYLAATFASLAGVVSPNYAANSWKALAMKEHAYWANKNNQDSAETGHLYEIAVSSTIVNIYLGFQSRQQLELVKNCFWTAKIFGTGNSYVLNP